MGPRTPGADVAGVSPFPVHMWQGRAQSRCRCGTAPSLLDRLRCTATAGIPVDTCGPNGPRTDNAEGEVGKPGTPRGTPGLGTPNRVLCVLALGYSECLPGKPAASESLCAPGPSLGGSGGEVCCLLERAHRRLAAPSHRDSSSGLACSGTSSRAEGLVRMPSKGSRESTAHRCRCAVVKGG